MNTAALFLLFLPVAFAGWKEEDAKQEPSCNLPQNPCEAKGIGSTKRWFYARDLKRCKQSGECTQYGKHGYSALFSCEKAHQHCTAPRRTTPATTTTITPSTPAVTACSKPEEKKEEKEKNKKEEKKGKRKKDKKGKNKKKKPKKTTKKD
uniref:Putative salivary mucin n=1 Tax=Ornithodoros turicata TaxID=34597 RepID=A0A2R5L7J6_9ACAR